jgi:hypothetical protein
MFFQSALQGVAIEILSSNEGNFFLSSAMDETNASDVATLSSYRTLPDHFTHDMPFRVH